jgi:hypothetical protein
MAGPGPLARWDQKQRERALAERRVRDMTGPQVLSTRDEYGRKVMRYIDPNTGDYYDINEMDVERRVDYAKDIDFNDAMRMAMEDMAMKMKMREYEDAVRRQHEAHEAHEADARRYQ